MTRLGELIADHPGLLAEDEENWTSTGHTEVARIGRAAAPDPLQDNERQYVASWAEHKDPRGDGAASSWVPMPFSQAKAILIGELRRNLQRWRGTGGSDPSPLRRPGAPEAGSRRRAADNHLARTRPAHRGHPVEPQRLISGRGDPVRLLTGRVGTGSSDSWTCGTHEN
jgi:hypothetical protein